MDSITLAYLEPYVTGLRALPGGDITAFIILLAVLAMGFDLTLALLLRLLGLLVGKTQTTLDDRILKVLGKYLPPISILTSFWITLEVVYPGINLIGGQGDFDIYITLMLILAGFLLSSIIDAVLLWYGLEMRPKAGKKVRDVEVFPFVRNVVKIAILAIFAVFILNRLGFETAAIITGLGVGGIAVALALQDTLGNFFGGLHILMDKPAREEDYVRLENGLEGTIKQIGWRTTRIVTADNNEVIVPNSKLAGSILQNYSTPNDMSAVTYTVGVECREDVDRVEKVIVAALHRVAKKDQLMDGKSTWARFDSFGDYSLNFKFGYMVRGYVNRFGVLKSVNRELFYAFRKEGITIPYPTRTVYQVNPEAGK